MTSCMLSEYSTVVVICYLCLTLTGSKMTARTWNIGQVVVAAATAVVVAVAADGGRELKRMGWKAAQVLRKGQQAHTAVDRRCWQHAAK